MLKTHEITLYTSQFTKFTNNNFLIIKNGNFNEKDYILVKEIETVGEETKETGLHRMTRIKEIVTDEGLKDGYVMLNLIKL